MGSIEPEGQRTVATVSIRAETELVTGDDLLAMGDIGPCELVDGRIVAMSPTGAEHGLWESRIGRLLGNFVEARRLGWVLTGEVGVYTRRNPDRVRGADAVFLSRHRSPTPPSKGYLEVPPDVVVEVISPDDRWQHIREKIEEYFAMGVGRVWIAEPDTRSLLVYRSPTDVTRYGPGDEVLGDEVLAGLALAVDDIYAL